MTLDIATVTLDQCEAVIADGLGTFIDVGMALWAIRDKRLYKEGGYLAFADYVRERWPDIGSLRRANQTIVAAQTVKLLGTTVPIELTEGLIRPLTVLPVADRAAAWQRAVDDANGHRLTAARVTAAVQDMQQVPEGAAQIERSTPRPHAITLAEWNRLHPDLQMTLRDTVEDYGTPSQFNRTDEHVEWAHWTWNPVTGCEHDCPYCYARDIAQRLYTYLEPADRFTPVFYPGRLKAPYNTPVPDADPADIGEHNVFVCSMADLFGKWVPQYWIDAVFDRVEDATAWNFLFLTKFPQRLAEQSWPANAWVGTTVDKQARVATAERAFAGVQAGVKWLSCEPLLERLTFRSLSMFDWVVIGGCSASTQTPEFQPPWEWVEHLMAQARAAGCQIYVKPNLKTRPREYPTGAIVR